MASQSIYMCNVSGPGGGGQKAQIVYGLTTDLERWWSLVPFDVENLGSAFARSNVRMNS